MTKLKRLICAAVLSAPCTMVQFALADEPTQNSTPTQDQLMKDCVRKHQSGDVNLSKAQLTRICKDELKQQKTTGTPPPPPPVTDGPQTPQTPPP